MAEGREATAWVNASRMSNATYMFVEGTSDEHFWKKFVNTDIIHIQQVNGWEKVVHCVREFNAAMLSENCIGVIDRDFDNIYPHKSVNEDNIFMTDYHDIEMMMYKSNAWNSTLQAIDKNDKIKQQPSIVLSNIFGITNKIGYLKLTSQKESFGLIFKKYDKQKELELPKYEKILDDNGEFKGDGKLIEYIYGYSNANKKNSQQLPSVKDITVAFTDMCLTTYPSEELSNGHDVSYIIPFILRRKFKLKLNYLNMDTILITLLAAYHLDDLKQTNLYALINAWGETHNKNIFL